MVSQVIQVRLETRVLKEQLDYKVPQVPLELWEQQDQLVPVDNQARRELREHVDRSELQDRQDLMEHLEQRVNQVPQVLQVLQDSRAMLDH